jgi:hypothetical protein
MKENHTFDTIVLSRTVLFAPLTVAQSLVILNKQSLLLGRIDSLSFSKASISCRELVWP